MTSITAKPAVERLAGERGREVELRSGMEEARRLKREMKLMWLWRILAYGNRPRPPRGDEEDVGLRDVRAHLTHAIVER